MRVASKVVKLPSKFGHAKPLRYRIIRYVRDDGQTDGRTDKSNAYRPLPYGRGIKIPKVQERQIKIMVQTVNMVSILSCSAMLECDIATDGVSVCPSVCHTLVVCQN